MMRSGVRLSSAPLSVSQADRGRYREPPQVEACGSKASESGSRTGFPLGDPRMARLSKNALPSLRLHKASEQGVVTLNGRDFYLGDRTSPDCEERYNALIARWISNGRRPIDGPRDDGADDGGILTSADFSPSTPLDKPHSCSGKVGRPPGRPAQTPCHRSARPGISATAVAVSRATGAFRLFVYRGLTSDPILDKMSMCG